MGNSRPGLGLVGLGAQSYSTQYVQECFAAWYKNDRPAMNALVNVVPVYEISGTRPNAITLSSWRKMYDWDVQADMVDSQAITKFQDQLAGERAEMMQRHAATAIDLQNKALEYLKENDFENTSVALRALELGLDTERASRGLRGGVVNIFNMGDDQLSKELEGMLNRLSAKDTDVVDGQAEDIDGIQEG